MVTYTTTADCGTDRTITNKATLQETTPRRITPTRQSVVLDCNQLTVSKTATTYFERDWDWTVVKGADGSDGTLELAAGQSFQPGLHRHVLGYE